MRRHAFISSTILLTFSAVLLLLAAGHLTAEREAARRLVPIGAGYEPETLALFAAQAIAHDSDGVVQIRLLPVTYASNAYNITPQERQANYNLALSRSDEVEAACDELVSGPMTCVSTVPNIQIRSDAQDPLLVAMLDAGVDGIFIPGGDQLVGMEVTAETLLEDALENLYLAGAAIGGNSAGAAVQSRYMIAGYTGNNYAWHGLELGAVDLWYGPTDTITRGLRFGLDSAVIEQHVLERGRLARLLQATERLPEHHVGLGVDWGTGAVVEDGVAVSSVGGWYAALVVDQETYGAAAGAAYNGPRQILSIHDVALHVLPEGPYGYDLVQHRPILNGVPDPTVPDLDGRDFAPMCGAEEAGPLFLTGDLGTTQMGEVSQQFAAQAQSALSPTLVLAAGYPNNSQATTAAQNWASTLTTLGVTAVQTATLTNNTNLDSLAAKINGAGAVFLTGRDQVTMAAQVALLQGVGIDLLLRERWEGGMPLLLDNAAAAAAGSWMSAEPTPNSQTLEIESSDSFLVGHIEVAPGLNILPGVVIEPRFLYDYLYGRLVSHIYAHSDVVTFGIERGTAITIVDGVVSVAGVEAVMAIDGRYATTLAEGTNDVIAATWLLVDTFGSGEVIEEAACMPVIPPVVETIYLPAVLK